MTTRRFCFAFASVSRLFSSAPLQIKSSTFHLSSSFSTSTAKGTVTGSRKMSVARKVVIIASFILFNPGFVLVTGDDLYIFHECSSKALEKASQNQKVIEALGEPIVRGPWYNASLVMGHRRDCATFPVSCTFPVSGPHGTGIFQLEAIKTGDDTFFSFLGHHDWDILVLEAVLHVPSNDEKNQTFRISLTHSDSFPYTLADCKDCSSCPVPAGTESNA